jgi:uncharacterized protein (UPF0303 family)
MSTEPPDLDQVDLDDAWRLGTTPVEHCRSEGLSVTISIQMVSSGSGAVPIRVRGTLVGVLAISGLESSEDHELAVSALTAARSPSTSSLGLEAASQEPGSPTQSEETDVRES